jgi:hypothetical protein
MVIADKYPDASIIRFRAEASVLAVLTGSGREDIKIVFFLSGLGYWTIAFLTDDCSGLVVIDKVI